MTRVGHGSRSLELKGTKCGNRGNARSDTISRDGAKPQKDHAEDTYPVAAYACAGMVVRAHDAGSGRRVASGATERYLRGMAGSLDWPFVTIGGAVHVPSW